MAHTQSGATLLVDVGNSFIKTRVWRPGNGLYGGDTWPVESPPSPEDIPAGSYEGLVMASVSPSAGSHIAATAAAAGLPVYLVTPGVAESSSSIRGLYEGMGQDRVAATVALAEFFPLPALAVDAGTAVTLDLVGEGARYAGGLIAPGARLMVRALSCGTALLQEVTPRGRDSILATDTEAAVAGGAFWGSACMIDGLLRVLESRGYGWKALILTGGDAGRVSRNLQWEHVVDPDLVFKGMAHVWHTLYAGAHTR